jgi:hypothetical protein
MKPVFDFKHEMDVYKDQLWKRLAQYVRANPEQKVEHIARRFNVRKTMLWKACIANGLKRQPGRRKWHFPAR